MANQSNQKPTGCCGIVLIVLFFPYVLLFWLFKFLVTAPKDPPQKAGANAIYAVLSGAFFIIAGIGYVCAGFAGELESTNPNDIVFGMVVIFFLFCGGGVALLFQSRKYSRLNKLYNAYIPCVLSSDMRSIDQIAQVRNVSYETALKNLELLLNKGAIPGASINYQTRMVELPKEPEPERVTKICPHCNGETSVIVGQAAVCDYCDMPLDQ